MAKSTASGARRGVSITVTLATAMIAFAVVLGGSLIVFSYVRNTEAASLAAEEALDGIAGNVVSQTLDIVRPMVAVASVTSELTADRPRPGALDADLERYLAKLLRVLPRVTSVYYGFEDGDFIQFVGLEEYRSWVPRPFELPANAAVVRVSIRHAADEQGVRTIEYLDEALNLLASERQVAEAYDPRTRPWYRLATASDEVVWTEPYLFAGSRQIGMTVAKQATPGRVLGIDLTLGSLSAFLESEKPTDDSLIVLLSRSGKVLAYAGPRQPTADGFQRMVKRPALPALTDVNDPLANAIHRFLVGERQPLPQLLTVDGREYVARRKSIAGPLGGEADLVMAVPAEVFTGPITRLGQHSVVMSLGILLISIPAIVWLSRMLSRSLKTLAGEAEAVRRFQFDAPVEVRSRITEISELAESMDRMREGVRSFGIYVPRGLVRHLLERRIAPSLGGTRRDVTVLFTDIAGFTPIAEGLEPEEVMRRMTAYFEMLTSVLRENGAIIDKFMGDAVMALWNAITPDLDHVASACRAVLRARSACDALNARLSEQTLAPMPTRFGLHTGEAVVGNVGSSERMSFTALGATVNLAARIEPLNTHFGTSVLVSDAVAACAREQFCLRTAGLVKPKGVAAPLRVHELICEAQQRPMHPIALRAAEWEAAFEAYVAGDWHAAAAAFSAFAEAFPGDALTRLYAERASRLDAAPASDTWTPVETFDTK